MLAVTQIMASARNALIAAGRKITNLRDANKMITLPEPRTLSRCADILDGEVVRSDWEGRPRFYVIRFYPVERGSYGQRRVMVHVQLEGDPSAFKFLHCDDDVGCRFDAVSDCIGEIQLDMDSTWDREAVDELEDRRAVEQRTYYR